MFLTMFYHCECFTRLAKPLATCSPAEQMIGNWSLQWRAHLYRYIYSVYMYNLPDKENCFYLSAIEFLNLQNPFMQIIIYSLIVFVNQQFFNKKSQILSKKKKKNF